MDKSEVKEEKCDIITKSELGGMFSVQNSNEEKYGENKMEQTDMAQSEESKVEGFTTSMYEQWEEDDRQDKNIMEDGYDAGNKIGEVIGKGIGVGINVSRKIGKIFGKGIKAGIGAGVGLAKGVGAGAISEVSKYTKVMKNDDSETKNMDADKTNPADEEDAGTM